MSTAHGHADACESERRIGDRGNHDQLLFVSAPGRCVTRGRPTGRTRLFALPFRIANRARSAVAGALNRAARSRRPKLRDIDWNRTIAANLTHYIPEHRTVIPERLIG